LFTVLLKTDILYNYGNQKSRDFFQKNVKILKN